MFKTTVLFFALIFSFLVQGKVCQDYKAKPLIIGCTYECDYWVRSGLRKAARRFDTNILIVNLIKNKSISINDVDAIVIPGGSDINPDYYIDKLSPKWKEITERFSHHTEITNQSNLRDPFEYNILTDYFSKENLRSTPILGICRGMQMLTVSQGIPLYQDIKAELGIPNRRYKLDRVYITDFNSLIYEVRKKKSFKAVELHHQGLRMDYWLENASNHPNLKVTAVSNNKRIAEAIEFKNRPILAVQFHPETTFGKTRKRVFDWIVSQACTKREKQ